MNSDRPPFILVFVADMQGCAFHRCMTPLASLVESGVADGRIDAAMWPDEVAHAANPDVIVWQRQVEDGQIEVMERWRKMLPNALFVYELDDYLGEIPAASFHASLMPPDIEPRLRRAVALCDRTTTTTEPMAEWLRSLGAPDVRVVPNGLPQARLREREPRAAGQRLRVGWAGGMSHAGDLEILRPAMEAIGDEVTWVFMGMQLENPPVRVEYHEGVPVVHYLDAMAQLDLDLVLAPLEDNPFNRCKSNLRLIEAGAMGACAIAQNALPYKTDFPPLFAQPTTPDQWTAAIRSFMKARPAERKRSADALRAWVGRKYTLERILQRRIDAWLPAVSDGEGRWKPSTARHADGSVRPVLACVDGDSVVERMPFLRHSTVCQDGLETACRKAIATGADVLWLRPATTLTEEGIKAVMAAAAQTHEIASAVPLTSDGANGFPFIDKWSPIPPSSVPTMDVITRGMFAGRRLVVPAPSGPVVLLTRHALSMLGVPDVAGCDGNEEQAILEWGARAAGRHWKHMQAPEAYAASIAPPAQPTQRAALRLQARGFSNALGGTYEKLTDDEREQFEFALLRSQWGGPRPGSAGFTNDYEAWSALRAAQDGAKSLFTTKGQNITVCTFGDKEGDLFATDDWVVFVDDSTELRVNADMHLLEAAVSASDDVRVVYADNEIVFPDGKRAPEFKPDFDLEFFLAQDYVTSVCAVRIDVLEGRVPGDRTDLYRMILQVALEHGGKAFLHVPHVFGAVKLETTPERAALDALSRQVVIQEALDDAVDVIAHRGLPGSLVVTRKLSGSNANTDPPLVSIVVPTLGGSRLIQPCVATILQHTRYPNYEIVVVQNGERQEPELSPATLTDPHVRVVHFDDPEKRGFNWSRLNNWAIVNHVKGEYVVAMNDDICVGAKNWLDDMMGQAVQSDVGCVGARLLHPMGVIQHVGVVCHNGVAGHMHKGTQNGQPGHMGRALLTHEASAVTGACMLFSRKNFDLVGGFDESLSHNYGDTAFCLSMRKHGLRNVVQCTAELLHPEGTSRPSAMSQEGMRKLMDEGLAIARQCPGPDPYWSPNLAVGMIQGGMAIQGLNAEALAWKDFVPPDDAERVLLVNDVPGIAGAAVSVIATGGVPMFADLSGFTLRLSAPNSPNARPWNIRNSAGISRGLKALGVTKVVIRSLVGSGGAEPPVESLRAFAALDVPCVVVDPVEPIEVAWWLGPEGSEAAAKDVFGDVDESAWREAYGRVLARSEEHDVKEAAD